MGSAVQGPAAKSFKPLTESVVDGGMCWVPKHGLPKSPLIARSTD